ncbi:hypothetical protein ACLMJK_005371 [Lecanora helva]
METPEPQSHSAEAEETPGQKQARLRRERREAKIKAGGSARLEKITNVSGRQNLPEPTPVAPQPSADPDEVDLSTHPSALPRSGNNGPTEDDIRALLRSADPQSTSQEQPQSDDSDPMFKLLQQIMGSGSSPNTTSSPDTAGLPPALASLLSGTAPPPATPSAPRYAHLWRILHALFALTLGIYIIYNSHAFTGDVTRGGLTGAGYEGGKNVFWAFATAELVLQSSRFFWERWGKDREGEVGMGVGGWMGLLGGVLPEPWKGWAGLAGRYVGIWGTVVEDGMVVVWVVGVVAWWRGAVG